MSKLYFTFGKFHQMSLSADYGATTNNANDIRMAGLSPSNSSTGCPISTTMILIIQNTVINSSIIVLLWQLSLMCALVRLPVYLYVWVGLRGCDCTCMLKYTALIMTDERFVNTHLII